MALDRELRAIQRIMVILAELNEDQASRVLNYAMDRMKLPESYEIREVSQPNGG